MRTERKTVHGNEATPTPTSLLDDETILLERQFRYPLRRHFIELAAGKIEAGEDPLATMRRELREECGYEAAVWRHLATLHPCIGYPWMQPSRRPKQKRSPP